MSSTLRGKKLGLFRASFSGSLVSNGKGGTCPRTARPQVGQQLAASVMKKSFYHHQTPSDLKYHPGWPNRKTVPKK
jgi:hypothetical protein